MNGLWVFRVECYALIYVWASAPYFPIIASNFFAVSAGQFSGAVKIAFFVAFAY